MLITPGAAHRGKRVAGGSPRIRDVDKRVAGGSPRIRDVRTRTAFVVAAALLTAATLAGCGAKGDGSGVPEELQLAATAQPSQVPGADGVLGNVPSIEAPAQQLDVPVYTANLDHLAAQREPEPVRLMVPDINLEMDVTDVGLLTDGTLEIPERAAVAGWYRAMASPGADDGIALLAAHVDDAAAGLGPFALLKDLQEGAQVEVELDSGQEVSYEVSAIEQTSKKTVDFERILDGSLGHHLVLVTCGGEFDWNTRHYDDNVIVWAERVND